MYRSATFSAYDVMDKVHVTGRLVTYEANGENFDKAEFAVTTTVDSHGEDDDREWLREALVALLEAI